MKLTKDQLGRRVPPDILDFATTRELADFEGILGQPRATEALEFGLGMEQPGYNLYIAGDAGTGRIRYLLSYLQPRVGQHQTPSDWLYVNNFDTPLEPRAISMPNKQGSQLLRDIDHLIDALLDTFPAAFENPSYIQRRNALQARFDETYDDAISQVRRAAVSRQVAMFYEEGSVSFSPLIDGKVADDAQFASLDEKEMDYFQQQVDQLEQLLSEVLLELPQWQRDLNDGMRQLREATIAQALKPLFQSLRQRYTGYASVSIYLAQMLNHLPRVIEEHFGGQGKAPAESPSQQRKLLEGIYRPNLLTSAMDSGMPVIQESNPNYQNLFGRVSFSNDESAGACQHITPGALHRANGGYLILNVEKLLAGDNTWSALKRMLRDGCINLEPPPGEIQLGGVIPLRPEPIPLDIKVILIGPREIYYTLDQLDPDFNELFRVLVDFESVFASNGSTLNQFAHLVHSRARESGLSELSAAAVARLAEHAHRLAEHQLRLTARIDAIVEIVSEADFACRQDRASLIEVEHINRAIEARSRRNARLRDRLLEDILDGTVVISTEGNAKGQVNGLSLLQVGDMAFGCPTRITATVHPGSRGVVDIEREVELGQPVHSKGVMILTGYLCSCYAQEFPLGVSAHIAMEQSYSYIDGDSASLAELCALLSALVGQPLRQDLAVTGSINQRGEIQAVGGVNEKVECFYDLCQARGLTGNQGVILPASNQLNLMLSDRVIEAVAKRQFNVYAVATVNEALGILTGKEPGKANSKGQFPKGTLNDRILKRLAHFARLTRSLSETGG